MYAIKKLWKTVDGEDDDDYEFTGQYEVFRPTFQSEKKIIDSKDEGKNLIECVKCWKTLTQTQKLFYLEFKSNKNAGIKKKIFCFKCAVQGKYFRDEEKLKTIKKEINKREYKSKFGILFKWMNDNLYLVNLCDKLASFYHDLEQGNRFHPKIVGEVFRFKNLCETRTDWSLRFREASSKGNDDQTRFLKAWRLYNLIN